MPNFKVEKDFMIDDYRCVVVGQDMGHRCGYVGLPKSHPLSGTRYEKINVDVHGGLTYGRENENYPVENAEKRWYIGFVCAHCYDIPDAKLIDELSPKEFAEARKSTASMYASFGKNMHLWTIEDVEKELKDLVGQLKRYEFTDEEGRLNADIVTVRREWCDYVGEKFNLDQEAIRSLYELTEVLLNSVGECKNEGDLV